MWERSVRTVSASLICALGLAANATAGNEPGSIRWDGDSVDVTTIDARLGSDPAHAIELWQGWVEEHGYRFEVPEDGRVVLVVDARQKSLRRQFKIVGNVGKWFDETLPPTFVVTKGVEDASAPSATARPTAATLGQAELPRTPVVFSLADDSDYASLLDHLVEIEPYLADWASHARGATGGFTLARPLVAGWVENGAGREEWNPDNELAHRLGHLFLLERYGQLPFWLQTGMSWQIEQEVAGDIYCFPYRSGFVGVLEHDGWKSFLKTRFKKRKKPDDYVRIEEIGAWKRGRFVEDGAAHAWGLARFLVDRHPEALPHVLSDLSQFRAENEIETFEDGSWRLIPGYEVPLEEQEAIFVRHVGEEFRAELTEFFRKGR